MSILPGFVVQAVATALLWLALWLPVTLWAFRSRSRRGWTQLVLIAGLLFVDLLCLMAPRAGPFARLDWNWQGKLLGIAWVLLLAGLPGYSLSRFGFRWRLEAGALAPIAAAAVAAVAFGLLPWLAGMQMSPDRETWLFESTMPGIAEELVYRGVFQSLINEAFARPWRIAGASFGWGAVLTLALFAIGHATIVTKDFYVVTSLAGGLLALTAGTILGWLRERTESVWPCILIHNLVNVAPLVAASLNGR